MRKYKDTKYLQDAVVIIFLGLMPFLGILWQVFSWGSDPAHYQCYSLAFWQGKSELQELPSRQCRFLVNLDKGVMFISQDELLHATQQWKWPSNLIRFVAAQSSDQ